METWVGTLVEPRNNFMFFWRSVFQVCQDGPWIFLWPSVSENERKKGWAHERVKNWKVEVDLRWIVVLLNVCVISFRNTVMNTSVWHNSMSFQSSCLVFPRYFTGHCKIHMCFLEIYFKSFQNLYVFSKIFRRSFQNSYVFSKIPCWELTKKSILRHFWGDDFPNFPWWDMYPFPGGYFTGPFRKPCIDLDVSENSGFSPQIIHFNRVFHSFHHPFWGTPIFGNTHFMSSSIPGPCLRRFVSGRRFNLRWGGSLKDFNGRRRSSRCFPRKNDALYWYHLTVRSFNRGGINQYKM